MKLIQLFKQITLRYKKLELFLIQLTAIVLASLITLFLFVMFFFSLPADIILGIDNEYTSFFDTGSLTYDVAISYFLYLVLRYFTYTLQGFAEMKSKINKTIDLTP